MSIPEKTAHRMNGIAWCRDAAIRRESTPSPLYPSSLSRDLATVCGQDEGGAFFSIREVLCGLCG